MYISSSRTDSFFRIVPEIRGGGEPSPTRKTQSRPLSDLDYYSTVSLSEAPIRPGSTKLFIIQIHSSQHSRHFAHREPCRGPGASQLAAGIGILRPWAVLGLFHLKPPPASPTLKPGSGFFVTRTPKRLKANHCSHAPTNSPKGLDYFSGALHKLLLHDTRGTLVILLASYPKTLPQAESLSTAYQQYPLHWPCVSSVYEHLADTREVIVSDYRETNRKSCSVVVLAYDWLLVLDNEVAFIWTKSWSFLKCIYLISRYTPWVDVILTLYYSFHSSLGTEACHRIDIMVTLLLAAGLWISELILVWRTYVIWGKSRRVLFGLGGMWLVSIPPAGCYVGSSNFLAAGDFILLVLAEIVIVILTLIKGIQHVRTMTGMTPVITTLYRDGVLFFICLLVISLVNILVPLLESQHKASISLAMFLRVMHSTLCCRVLLNIRTAALSVPSTEASQYPSPFSTCACTLGEACNMQHPTEYWELEQLRAGSNADNTPVQGSSGDGGRV
ncbi:hypothetical protein BDY19DRAFT_208207 [Irpex rosettiformis]|uniref:Uncharacterized protein n=1 Tax=Irpex rosettiformis TaxID=378272 RepID=A0ACB8U1X4_9APHY|nr:hypothetical protein BDY19DRAFT_208207 [Irpex rosettiformis]